MMKKVIILLVICLFLPGCWDLTEPEKLGLVMAMGVDLAENNQIELTCAEVNVRSVAGGGMGSNGATVEPPFHIHSGTGSTVLEAIRRMSREAAYRLFFGHIQAIILSEELATTRGIRPVIDFFERDPEMRRGTWLLIAKKGQLTKVITSDMPIKDSKGQFLAGIIKHRERSSFYAPNRLGDFVEFFTEQGHETYTAGVTLTSVPSGENPASSGNPAKPQTADLVVLDTAIFKDDKMVGWFNDRESRGLLWVKGQVQGGVINAPWKNQQIALEILSSQAQMKPVIVDGKIQFNIHIKVKSNIGESQTDLDFSQTKVIEEIQKLQSQEVKKEIVMAFNKSKELESDPFGFGRSFYASYPQQWNQIKEQWYEYYPNIALNITVDSEISRIGIISKTARKPDRKEE